MWGNLEKWMMVEKSGIIMRDWHNFLALFGFLLDLTG